MTLFHDTLIVVTSSGFAVAAKFHMLFFAFSRLKLNRKCRL